MNMFHRLMRARALPIVVVVVAYPATPLTTGRVRFCVSAAHTKADVDVVLRACDEIGDVLDLKHGLKQGERWSVEECIRRAGGARECVRWWLMCVVEVREVVDGLVWWVGWREGISL